MTAPRPVILDCDPGQDDAVAILLALASPAALEVRALTAVAGNVPLALTQRNARRVRELAGRPDVPVFAGADRPLGRALATATHVHGEDGLAGVDLPEPVAPLAAAHAADAIVEIVMGSPAGSVTLCPVGPLTNIALALAREPRLAARVARIVMMGGAVGPGNVTPAAEFNVFVDPEAARQVFASGAPIVMLPLDVTHQALATRERVAAIAALGTKAGRAVAGLLAHGFTRDLARHGGLGPPLHDPCAVGYLLWPELFEGSARHVAIETSGEHTAGMTVVDRRGGAGAPPNATVIERIDAARFFARLTEALARLRP